jgi:hypothetical protein
MSQGSEKMAEQNSNFEPQITAKFSRRLKKDEYIVWAGTSLEGYESGWIFSEKSLHLVFPVLTANLCLVQDATSLQRVFSTISAIWQAQQVMI